MFGLTKSVYPESGSHEKRRYSKSRKLFNGTFSSYTLEKLK